MLACISNLDCWLTRSSEFRLCSSVAVMSSSALPLRHHTGAVHANPQAIGVFYGQLMKEHCSSHLRVQTLTEMLIELINPLLLHSHWQHAGSHFHPTSPSFPAGFCGIVGELRATGLMGLGLVLPRAAVSAPPAHLRPFCTTRFLQVLQHEHAWLHSKIRGGSAMLNSGRSRPS